MHIRGRFLRDLEDFHKQIDQRATATFICSLSFYYCGKKIHNINFTMLTMFKGTGLWLWQQTVKYIHIAVQPSSPSISRTFPSSQTEAPIEN